MRRRDLLNLNGRTSRLSPIHHQLLHRHRNGPILLTNQIRRRDLIIRRTSRRRILRRPRMRSQRSSPLLPIRNIMEEKPERVTGCDGSILNLNPLIHAFSRQEEKEDLHREYTTEAGFHQMH